MFPDGAIVTLQVWRGCVSGVRCLGHGHGGSVGICTLGGGVVICTLRGVGAVCTRGSGGAVCTLGRGGAGRPGCWLVVGCIGTGLADTTHPTHTHPLNVQCNNSPIREHRPTLCRPPPSSIRQHSHEPDNRHEGPYIRPPRRTRGRPRRTHLE